MLKRVPECQGQYIHQPSYCRIMRRSSVQERLDTKDVLPQKVRNPLYLHSDLIAVISQDLVSRMHKKRPLIRTVGIQPWTMSEKSTMWRPRYHWHLIICPTTNCRVKQQPSQIRL